MPLKKLQIKSGPPINLLQFILGLALAMGGAVGLYVKDQVEKQKVIDRVDAIEKKMDKNEANAQIRKVARDDEIKSLKSDVIQNKQDIVILKITKKDK